MTKTYEQLLEQAKAVAVAVRKEYGMDDVLGLLKQFEAGRVDDLRTEQLPPFIDACRAHLVKDDQHDTTSQQVESLAQSDAPQLFVNVEGIKVTDRASAQTLVDLLQKKYDLLDDNAILRDLMEKMEERHGEEFNAFFEATISAIMEAMNLDELRVSTAAVIYNAAISSGLVCSEEPGALVYRRVTPADVIDPNEKVIINPPQHILYKKGDIGIPDAIRDRNGDVVLDLCKVCGKGEQELLDTPVCPGPYEKEKGSA